MLLDYIDHYCIFDGRLRKHLFETTYVSRIEVFEMNDEEK